MLKKVFASCAIACLIFSVSLVPCFAENYGAENVTDMFCSVGFYETGQDDEVGGVTIPTPIEGLYLADLGTNRYSGLEVVPNFKSRSTFFVEEAYTLYFQITPVIYDQEGDAATNSVSFNSSVMNTDLPIFITYTNRPGNDGVQQTVERVWASNESIQGNWSVLYRTTIPADCNGFICNYPGTLYDVVNTATPSPLFYAIECFQYFPTTDNSIIGILDSILTETQDIGIDVSSISSVVGDIYNKLDLMQVDVSDMEEILEHIAVTCDNNHTVLSRISNNLSAVYALLATSLDSESAEIKENAQQAIVEIQESANQQAIYQAQMQSSYESVNLEGFEFGNLVWSMDVVTQIFGDIWNALGYWVIAYTFPLYIAISLLVIGRIPKFGGGNSARNAEHKGGDGGA